MKTWFELKIYVLRAFIAVSLKRVYSLSFRKNFKKVTKTAPHQLS
jgi:hypothetical protein